MRESGGAIVAVSEAEIVDALRELARKGLYVEPTSAAGAAGLTQLIASGLVKRDETTVLVLTGSGLKASERIGELLALRARSSRSIAWQPDGPCGNERGEPSSRTSSPSAIYGSRIAFSEHSRPCPG